MHRQIYSVVHLEGLIQAFLALGHINRSKRVCELNGSTADGPFPGFNLYLIIDSLTWNDGMAAVGSRCPDQQTEMLAVDALKSRWSGDGLQHDLLFLRQSVIEHVPGGAHQNRGRRRTLRAFRSEEPERCAVL